MELDNLKTAWSKYAFSEEQNRVFSEKEVNNMLASQTRNITYKIGRNIRVGLGIVLAWVVLGIMANFLLTPLFDEILIKPYMTSELELWSFLIETITYILVLLVIIIFWIRYSKFEKTEIVSSNLEQALVRSIAIVESYRKMFYVVLGVTLFYIAVSYTSGFLFETKYQAKESGINLSEMAFERWLLMLVAFIVTLGFFLGAYYLLFNFFFRRLYGRYLSKMKATLKELNESN